MTFHDDEHRINNTGWIRNGDETEKWNEKQNHRGDAERFSIYLFSIRNEAMSRIYACKNWEDSANIWLMHTIQTVISVDSTVLLLSTKTKQENQRNEASRLSENASKKSSALSHIRYGEVSLQIEFATLPPKNHNLFVKEEWKGNGNNKENAVTG